MARLGALRGGLEPMSFQQAPLLLLVNLQRGSSGDQVSYVFTSWSLKLFLGYGISAALLSSWVYNTRYRLSRVSLFLCDSPFVGVSLPQSRGPEWAGAEPCAAAARSSPRTRAVVGPGLAPVSAPQLLSPLFPNLRLRPGKEKWYRHLQLIFPCSVTCLSVFLFVHRFGFLFVSKKRMLTAQHHVCVVRHLSQVL